MDRDTPFRVVCVDDDPDILTLLQHAVSGEPDFEIVATTTNPADVVELLTVHRPDVLIVDDFMRDQTKPLGRSRQSAALVTIARELVPDATVVVFTGREPPDEPGSDLGDVWIPKPHMNTIWSAVRNARA